MHLNGDYPLLSIQKLDEDVKESAITLHQLKEQLVSSSIN
jgi:hypothetical protein